MTIKTKAQDFAKPKVMVANAQDLTTAYVQRMSKLGYVMLVLAIPDEQAHGKGSSQNVGVYGSIPDVALQVAVLREVADKIEASSAENESLMLPEHIKIARADN